MGRYQHQMQAKKEAWGAAKSAGATGRGVTPTSRGKVVSATTSSGAKINKNIKPGVGFGTRASGQKFIKPSSRTGR